MIADMQCIIFELYLELTILMAKSFSPNSHWATMKKSPEPLDGKGAAAYALVPSLVGRVQPISSEIL